MAYILVRRLWNRIQPGCQNQCMLVHFNSLFTIFLPSLVYQVWSFVLQNIHIPRHQIYLEIDIYTHTHTHVYMPTYMWNRWRFVIWKHIIQNITWRKVSDMCPSALPVTGWKPDSLLFSNSTALLFLTPCHILNWRKLATHVTKMKDKERWKMKRPQVMLCISSLTYNSSPSNKHHKLGLLVLACLWKMSRILFFLQKKVTFLCSWYKLWKLT